MALLREATTSSAVVSLAERAAGVSEQKLPNVFGNIQVDYPCPAHTMTLSMAAQAEWNAIEALLRKILQK
jgi:hypothetical protein